VANNFRKISEQIANGGNTMKKFMLFILITLFQIIITQTALAETLYVRSSGSGNGSSWANAFGGFSAVSWGTGSGKLGAGDTLYVAGGNYGSLRFGASGSNGNKIIIKKATVNEHGTNTGWNSSYDSQIIMSSINTDGLDYITVDGVIPHAGIKIVLGGGSGVYRAITATNSSHVSFKNMWMDASANYDDARGLYTLGGVDHLLFSYVRSTRFSNDHYLVIGVSNSIWEYLWVDGRNTSSSGKHADVWEIRSGGQGSNANIIRYSDINAHIDMVHTGILSGVSDWYVYGNVFRNANSAYKTNSKNPSGIDIYWFNNVVIDSSGTAIRSLSGTNFIAYNNAYYGNSGGLGTAGSYYTTTNVFANYNSGNDGGDWSLDDPPNPAIDDGHNVTRLSWWNASKCSTMDKAGNIWGADGTWDIGAFEFADSDAPPSPPQNFRYN